MVWLKFLKPMVLAALMSLQRSNAASISLGCRQRQKLCRRDRTLDLCSPNGSEHNPLWPSLGGSLLFKLGEKKPYYSSPLRLRERFEFHIHNLLFLETLKTIATSIIIPVLREKDTSRRSPGLKRPWGFWKLAPPPLVPKDGLLWSRRD